MSNVSRSVRRPGFGPMIGASNPKITVSLTAPRLPKLHDLWLNITASPAVWKWWDGSAWQL